LIKTPKALSLTGLRSFNYLSFNQLLLTGRIQTIIVTFADYFCDTMNKMMPIIILLLLLSGVSCTPDPEPATGVLQLSAIRVGSVNLSVSAENNNIPVDKPVVATFNRAVDTSTVKKSIKVYYDGVEIAAKISYLDQQKTISAMPYEALTYNTDYTIEIGKSLKSSDGIYFAGASVDFTTITGTLSVDSIRFNNTRVTLSGTPQAVSRDLTIDAYFSSALNSSTATSQNFKLYEGNTTLPVTVTLSNDKKSIRLTASSLLNDIAKHTFTITSGVKGASSEEFAGYQKSFYTQFDSTFKFTEISDDDLLQLIEQRTFRYFWDFGHPISGMARERNTSGDIVTSGGSGFGIMAIVIGMERGFISRSEGIARLGLMTDFLATADRFHGAWPHWLNGATGDVVPFSTNDNGGDLVETSYLAAGLLCARQYLSVTVTEEKTIIDKINTLLDGIEWSWYTHDGQDVLYWHWSPNLGWIMNMPIHGYDEALITYIMAATSTTYPVDAAVYHKGWALSGAIVNGKSFYGITLPLGYDYGGPLFFAHYSFLGIDPTNLSDQYASYMTQNVNHTLINRKYCITNPLGYVGYSSSCWGLTASDNQSGYAAHSPTNDLGVITPTAAISSIPYTPEYSLEAIRFFYYILGDKLWGDYGFYDAFNPTEGWWGNSYIAIDQGPEIVMIENYRSGLCWDLLMSAPEIKLALTRLGFTY
jgi:hypothetical protein